MSGLQAPGHTRHATPNGRRLQRPGARAPAPAPTGPVQTLHQRIGNRATRGLVQTKLRIGSPDDRYEREADQVADLVMRAPVMAVSPVVGGAAVLQRCACEGSCAACSSAPERYADSLMPGLEISAIPHPGVQREMLDIGGGMAMEPDEREAEEADDGADLVQRQASGRAPQLVSGFESRLDRLRSGGQPLSTFERAYFEPRFGRDLSMIRVHTDRDAERAAAEIGARAFTHGAHVFFGAGEYDARALQGRRLLAHELTHTVQQGAAGGKTAGSAGGSSWARPLVQRKPLDKPYRARIVEMRDDAGRLKPVLTCQDTRGTGCRSDVLTGGMEVRVTSEFFGGVWSFVENLPTPAIKALHGQKWIYVPTVLLERVADTAPKVTGGSSGTAATSDFLGRNWQDVNEQGIVYQPTGANVRDRPLPPKDGSVVLTHLAQNTKVFVLKHDPKAKWYAVTAIDPKGGGGTFGYVADWLIWRKLPEPDAAVIKIKSGEYPLKIAKDYYRGQGFTKWGHDPRYLVNALVFINQKADHNGVGPPGITKPKGDVTEDWAEASSRAETYIWIPSAPFMRAIYERVVEHGGGTGSITADLWGSVKKVLHGLAYGAAFIGGLVHGFVQSLYDAIAGLAGLVVDLLVSIFTGEVIKDAQELWDSISKLKWKEIKAAFGDWVDGWYVKLSSNSPWVAGHAHGYLTGYIMAEAAQLLISAGALAEVKAALWSSRLGKAIQGSKAYATLAKGLSTAAKVGGKTGEALKVAGESLKLTKVFHGLHAARAWAMRALNVTAEFAKDLSLGAINLLATLGDDALVQLRKLSNMAKRFLLRCYSPCNPDLPKLKEALANLKKLKVPRTAIELVKPGLTKGLNKVNPTLLRLARMKRALVGISVDAFKKYNVAVGRFVIEGGEELFVPVVNKSGALHAEEELLGHLAALRKKYPGKKVTLDELFTERIPCLGGGKNPANCRLKLEKLSPETKTFYAVAGSSATDLATTKAKWLMEVVYGLTK